MAENGEKNGRSVLTVHQLTAQIKGVLDASFPGLWVEGEISNFKTYPSGHAYFTLKDEKAQLRCVMWKGSRAYLRFEPKDGDQVVIRGRVTVYEKSGQYQLIAEAMEPKGLGALQAAFEKLKKKLAAEGLFDEARKKPLPYIPWTIGLVTSPRGAAVRDMIRTIHRRFPGLRVILNPVQVQGDAAAVQIARAIEEFNEYGKVDVIIAGRGGGSLEDLWAFNEEVVARAIAASKIPVVSAVGHEVDFTIADFVADLRASTPTAAAEQVAPEREAVEERIEDLLGRAATELRDMSENLAQRVDDQSGRAGRAIEGLLELYGKELAGAVRHLKALSPRAQLDIRRKRTDELGARAVAALTRRLRTARADAAAGVGRFRAQRPGRMIAHRREDTAVMAKNLHAAMRASLSAWSRKVDVARGRLEAYDPQRTLERGYSIVSSPDGKKVYKSVAELAPGARVSLRLKDGKTGAVIENKDKGNQQTLF